MRPILSVSVLALGVLIGCHQPDAKLVESNESDPSGPVSSISVNTEEILSRCAAVYSNARTLHIIGVLKDFRPGKQRVVPLLWDFERPNRSRLQVNMDVAVVLDQDFWIYTADRGRYSRHRQFTKSPIQTASYLISDGIPMLLADLWNGNPTVFNLDDKGTSWQLDGVDWSYGRQCFVLSMQQSDSQLQHTFSIWVDQEQMLIRKWAILAGSQERSVVECEFQTINVNSKLPSDLFFLEEPHPLTNTPTTRPSRPAKS